ncbi:hypothetical protein AYO47_06125 [Planctomyces sp. SCGC AG-212-M04]|nr:hypothetical protein AYO47_06125 [Planctomyces sp. SCGC AG-212-M04]
MRKYGHATDPFGDGNQILLQTGQRWHPVTLINSPAVQSELKLSEEQRAAVEALRLEAYPKLGRYMTFGTFGSLSRARNAAQTTSERDAERSAVVAELYAKLKSILSAEQHRRLEQLVWRCRGELALFDEDTANRLELPPETRKSLAKLDEGSSQKALISQLGSGDPRTTAEELQEKLLAVLTTEQRERWAELKGPPVNLEAFPDEQGASVLNTGDWSSFRAGLRETSDRKRIDQDHDVFVLLNRANTLRQQRKFNEALAICDGLLALPLTAQQRGSVLTGRGRIRTTVATGGEKWSPALKIVPSEFQAALDDFSEAILLSPSDSEAYTERSALYWLAGELHLAYRDADEAVIAQEAKARAGRRFSYLPVYLNRSRLRMISGDPKDAMEDADRALAALGRYTPASEIEQVRVYRLELFVVAGNYQAATEEASELSKTRTTSAFAANQAAWLFAVCPEAAARNGKLAVELALLACSSSKFERWNELDTLAAAYAENGEFEDAVTWEKKAIQLASPSDRAQLEERLRLYESKQPYRTEKIFDAQFAPRPNVLKELLATPSEPNKGSSVAVWGARDFSAERAAMFRPLAKEPAYQGRPVYFALFTGNQLNDGHWCAIDGQLAVYVDLDGDADLSDANERFPLVPSKIELRDPAGERQSDVSLIDSVPFELAGKEFQVRLWNVPDELLPAGPQLARWKALKERGLVRVDLVEHIGTQSQGHDLSLMASPRLQEAGIVGLGPSLTIGPEPSHSNSIAPSPCLSTLRFSVGDRCVPVEGCDFPVFSPHLTTQGPKEAPLLARVVFQNATGDTQSIQRIRLDPSGEQAYEGRVLAPQGELASTALVIVSADLWKSPPAEPVAFEVPVRTKREATDERSYVLASSSQALTAQEVKKLLKDAGLSADTSGLETTTVEVGSRQFDQKPQLIVAIDQGDVVSGLSERLAERHKSATVADCRWCATIRAKSGSLASHQALVNQVAAILSKSTGGFIANTGKEELTPPVQPAPERPADRRESTTPPVVESPPSRANRSPASLFGGLRLPRRPSLLTLDDTQAERLKLSDPQKAKLKELEAQRSKIMEEVRASGAPLTDVLQKSTELTRQSIELLDPEQKKIWKEIEAEVGMPPAPSK